MKRSVFALLVMFALGAFVGLGMLPLTMETMAWQTVNAPFSTTSDWQMTGVTSATAQSVVVPTGTRSIRLQPETNSIRWTSSGTSPTSTTGNFIAAGDVEFVVDSLSSLEVIGSSGTATINLHGSTSVQ